MLFWVEFIVSMILMKRNSTLAVINMFPIALNKYNPVNETWFNIKKNFSQEKETVFLITYARIVLHYKH